MLIPFINVGLCNGIRMLLCEVGNELVFPLGIGILKIDQLPIKLITFLRPLKICLVTVIQVFIYLTLLVQLSPLFLEPICFVFDLLDHLTCLGVDWRNFFFGLCVSLLLKFLNTFFLLLGYWFCLILQNKGNLTDLILKILTLILNSAFPITIDPL